MLHVVLAAAGGAARSTLSLILRLAEHGVDSVLVCGPAGGEAALERELTDAVSGRALRLPLYTWNRKIRVAAWKRPLLELRQAASTGCGRRSGRVVAAFAARHGVDLVHSSSILMTEGSAAAVALQLPHVWHLRELVGPGCPFRLPREGPPLGAYLARRASKVVANSRATAERVAAWLPPELLELVPNGIELSAFTSLAPERGGAEVVVAMVGSLSSRSKNHALFVEAAALVPAGGELRFRIYGDDPGDAYSSQLRARAAALGLGERFALMGYHPDPVALMGEIDVLVHPAHGESFGRVVVEAMAAGRPVVGVRGGGVGEIVEDGRSGFLVEPGDAGALAEMIRRLAGDRELRRAMGAEGRRVAVARYSAEACASGVVGVYRRALWRPLGRGASGARPTSPRGER